MPPAFLESEFDLAWGNRTQEHRQHLADAGITFQAMLRAGDLGVERITTTGRLYKKEKEGGKEGRRGRRDVEWYDVFFFFKQKTAYEIGQ